MDFKWRRKAHVVAYLDMVLTAICLLNVHIYAPKLAGLAYDAIIESSSVSNTTERSANISKTNDESVNGAGGRGLIGLRIFVVTIQLGVALILRSGTKIGTDYDGDACWLSGGWCAAQLYFMMLWFGIGIATGNNLVWIWMVTRLLLLYVVVRFVIELSNWRKKSTQSSKV